MIPPSPTRGSDRSGGRAVPLFGQPLSLMCPLEVLGDG